MSLSLTSQHLLVRVRPLVCACSKYTHTHMYLQSTHSAAHDVQVEIKCKDGTHALNLVWPTEGDPDAVEAKFRKKSGHLVLSAPVID